MSQINGSYYVDGGGGTTYNAPSGVYWTGSGAYYDSSSSSRKKYTCNNYKLFKGSNLSDEDDSKRGLSGTSFCTSISSAAGSGTVSNSSASLTYTNGSYTSETIAKLNSDDKDAKFSYHYSNWVWKSGSSSSVSATLTVYNTYSVDSSKWSETSKYSRSNYRFYLYACGGESGNSYGYRITAKSSTACYVKNNITGSDQYSKSFSKDLQIAVSGYSTRTEDDDGYWYYKNNLSDFDCSTRTKYTVSNLNIALHYRPRIKVRI